MKTKKSPAKKPTIEPRGKWVLVKPEIIEGKENEYGLIIPDAVEKDKKAVGEIISFGPEVKDLEKGQRVIYGKYAGEEIQLGNKHELKDKVDFILLLDEDILAILK